MKDFCKHLNPKHRTIYRRTLLRLLRVFVDYQNREVGTYGTKNHLEYGFACGSSNSDFWKNPARDEQFGPVCIKSVAKLFQFKNSLELAIFNTRYSRRSRAG